MLQMATWVNADPLQLADSDVLLMRPVTSTIFRQGGQIRFYRREKTVHGGMSRHLIRHDIVRKLLGVPPAPPPPLPDYVIHSISGSGARFSGCRNASSRRWVSTGLTRQSEKGISLSSFFMAYSSMRLSLCMLT